MPYMHAWQRHGKYVGLQLPARAVAGYVAHGHLRQQLGNAEVIGHLQAAFCLWEPH